MSRRRRRSRPGAPSYSASPLPRPNWSDLVSLFPQDPAGLPELGPVYPGTSDVPWFDVPEGRRPLRIVGPVFSPRRVVGPRRGPYFPPSVSIRAPSRADFCLRRAVRRQVLFAKKRAGYSGSAKKRSWRRTQNSYYRC